MYNSCSGRQKVAKTTEEQKAVSALRNKAQGRALRTLSRAHKSEYNKYYQEECIKLGLGVAAVKPEYQLDALQEAIIKLENLLAKVPQG
jgi:hypothetical protein